MNLNMDLLNKSFWVLWRQELTWGPFLKVGFLGKIGFTYLPNVTKSKVNKHNCYQFISVSHIWWYFHIHSLSEIFRLIQWQKNCCSNGGDSPTHHNTLKNQIILLFQALLSCSPHGFTNFQFLIVLNFLISQIVLKKKHQGQFW